VSADPRIGTELAGCRIEERLPMGGMSVVYRAEHLHLGRKVAIKLLDARLAEDEDYRRRFLRESRLAAALYHPNIVPIYDAGEAEGVPYITMHFVQGRDLAALLRAGSLPVERTLEIVVQAAAALDAAHDRGLVHRDVKPANILIASGDGVEPEGHVYLTDFGLAKQIASGTALTRQGLFMGTLDYVAPEQIQGHEVDRRTDVYSLGCVVYECLAGAVPFARDSEVAMLYAHMQEPPPAVSAVRPEIPPSADGVVARAMAKRAEDRYGGCRELVEELREALSAVSAHVPQEPAVSAIAQPAPAPDETPVAPPLVGVASMDYRGGQYGLGRTPSGYAVWDLLAGGHPIRLFPATPEAWTTAWDTFQELEATRSEEAAEAPWHGAPPHVEPSRTPSTPPELLVGVVFLDYRGARYALGRTQDAYAIWDQQAGGYPVQMFTLHPQAWPEVWQRYQDLEASASEPGPVETASDPARPAELAEVVAVDHEGGGYALGRTSGGHAIWDLTAGGDPVRVFTADSWDEAWSAFHDLEARGPG
jgi:hypothetical protein